MIGPLDELQRAPERWIGQREATQLVGVLELAPRPLTVVSTGSDNAPAVALYEKLGFAAVGREEVALGLVFTHFELHR